MGEIKTCRKCGLSDEDVIDIGGTITNISGESGYEHYISDACINALKANLTAAEAKVKELEEASLELNAYKASNKTAIDAYEKSYKIIADLHQDGLKRDLDAAKWVKEAALYQQTITEQAKEIERLKKDWSSLFAQYNTLAKKVEELNTLSRGASTAAGMFAGNEINLKQRIAKAAVQIKKLKANNYSNVVEETTEILTILIGES